jgi:hypothetical protein
MTEPYAPPSPISEQPGTNPTPPPREGAPAWLEPFDAAGVEYAKALAELCQQMSERLTNARSEYFAAVQTAWMHAHWQLFLHNAAEQYNTSLTQQLTELNAPHAAQQAFETYVAGVKDAWASVPPDSVELDTWMAIQHALQVGAWWRQWSLATLGRPSA